MNGNATKNSESECAMRREHRRPRIVGSVRLGGSSFVDSVLSCVVWRSAFVSCWFLSVLGGSWQFRKTLLLMAKHETNFAPLGRLFDVCEVLA